MEKKMGKAKICNILCIVLMGVLLVLHFMPFWSYDGISTSIQTYVWFPTEHADLGTYIAGQVGGDYNINSIVLMPVLVLVLTVIGIVLCIIKSENLFVGLLPLGCGLIGIWGYLSKAAFRLGTNWVLHLMVCIAMVAAGALKMYFLAKEE